MMPRPLANWVAPVMRLAAMLALVLSAVSAQAAYVQVFNTIQKGAITFTGNTLVIDSGTTGQGTGFIAANLNTHINAAHATAFGAAPPGTTLLSASNASRAVLTIPPGATVLHAELVWSGTIGALALGAYDNLAVTFTTPSGSFSIAPSLATKGTSGTYYTRSANVTGLIQIGGSGTYTVGGVAASINTGGSTDSAGWTLAVAYADPSKVARNLTIFVGAEQVGAAAAAVSGFCTPTSGPVNGRLAVSAIEGDSNPTGDFMNFGPATPFTTPRLSGNFNPIDNFFASQLNGDLGAPDASGTFGLFTRVPGANAAFRRQGYDVTNVNVSAQLINSQTTAFAQGNSSGDNFAINALGMQIDVNSPVFPVTVKRVDKVTTFVGDVLIYSVDLDNRAGNGAATSVVFSDIIPPGTSFVVGSVMVDTNPPLPNNPAVQTGTVQALANPANGIAIGAVAVGGVVRVSFRVNVVSLPASPAAARFDNSAQWTYTYIACEGVVAQAGSVVTGAVSSTAPRLEPTKTVSPTGALVGGQTAVYTITVPNTGLNNTAGTTLADPIPAGTTYVPGSTKLNGVTIADGPGSTMPFATAAPINSAGQSSGVIAVGANATVQFSVTATSGATVVNSASIDPDGAGPGPAIVVSAVNSALSGPAVSKAFLPNSIGQGATSVLTVTLTNANASAITGVSVTDNLPGNVVIASPANPLTNCPGGTASATPTGITLALTGASIPASGSCTFSANVTSTVPGTYINTIPAGAVSSNNAGLSTAGSNNIKVTPAPIVSKSFLPGTVAPNAAATLTITLTNPSAVAMTAVGFTDTFPTSPAGMNLINTTVTNSCGGTLTDSANVALAIGSTSVKLAGGTIAAGNVCTITVQVQAPSGGSYVNQIPSGALTTSGGANISPAIATLQVASPQVVKSFSPTSVAVNTNSVMTIVLTNVSNIPMTGIAFTDTYPLGLVNGPTAGVVENCSGAVTAANNGTSLALSATTLAAGASCTITVNVRSAAPGSYTNTIAAGSVTSTSHGSNAFAASAVLTVAVPAISKAFTASTIPLNGTTTLTITLSNPTATAMTGAAFTDTLPAGLTASAPGGTCLFPGGTRTASGSTIALTVGTIPAAGSCTVTATITGTTIGLKVNTIPVGGLTVTGPAALSNGIAAVDDVTVLAAPAVTKSFLTSPILPVTGVSTLRIVLENSTAVALTGATFTDVFPTSPGAMTIANLTTTNSCGGNLLNSAGGALAINDVGIRLTAGTIPANGTCVITVNVKASLAGDYVNTIPATPTTGFLNTTEGGGNTVAATAPLSVRLAGSTIVKTFSPATITANTASTLTLTLTNPSTLQAITGVALNDIFPAGMKVFSPPSFTNSCGGTVATGSLANETSISISGASIPTNSSCSISVAVTSTVPVASPGVTNTTSTVTSTNASTGAAASANLIVNAAPLTAPSIAKAFNLSTIGVGGTSTMTFTLGNVNAVVLNNANFTDTLTNMSVASATIGGTCSGTTNSPALLVGATSLNLTVPVLPPGGCTVTVQVTSSNLGANPNTTSGVTTTETPTAGAVSNTATLTVVILGVTVSGTVYSDTNHNASKDGVETGTGQAIFAKLIDSATPTTASQAVTVDPSTGAYSFTGVPVGAYSIVLDNNNTLADVTPSAPAGWVGTQSPTQTRSSVAVGAVNVFNQDFGLYNGSRLAGRVFVDSGIGAGVANDGIQNGGELGLPAVGVVAQNALCPATLCDSTTTNSAGDYTLWIPAVASGAVNIVQANLGGYISTGGQAGNTAGAYTRSTDTTVFTLVGGSVYTGVNFADVPDNSFVNFGSQTGLPGASVFYAHTFTAGTAGSVAFGTTNIASPVIAGWTNLIYRDTDCNGLLDGAEGASAFSSIAVTAGQVICVIVKEFIPAGAPNGAQDQVTVTATFTYTNASPALVLAYTRADTTTVGTAGLTLTKEVRNVTTAGAFGTNNTALPGQTLEYRITYTNTGSGVLSTVVLTDSTPAFTVFVSATCGANVPNITSCSATTQPSVGGVGALAWTLVGTLAPGSQSNVLYRVSVQP